MKKIFGKICICLFAFFFISCATFMKNSVSTMLSGVNENGKKQVSNSSDVDLMLALTGETDTVLMGDFFPTALKMYEIMLHQNPKHQGLAVMTGSLCIMYANAFVQHNADLLTVSQYSLKHKELARAKIHYLRGRNYVLTALDLRYNNFSAIVLGNDEAQFTTLLETLKKTDVDALYWLCAGWLGAFSLDPLDSGIIPTVKRAADLLEKVAQLDPDYNDGAIWNVLTAYLASAPQELGGNKEKAEFAHEEAMRVSQGKTIGPYLTYITSFCIPNNDSKGFDTAINTALAINPDDNPSTRFATTISRQKAVWLKEHKEDFIIDWGD